MSLLIPDMALEAAAWRRFAAVVSSQEADDARVRQMAAAACGDVNEKGCEERLLSLSPQGALNMA